MSVITAPGFRKGHLHDLAQIQNPKPGCASRFELWLICFFHLEYIRTTKTPPSTVHISSGYNLTSIKLTNHLIFYLKRVGKS